jgi:hypothetical protein
MSAAPFACDLRNRDAVVRLVIIRHGFEPDNMIVESISMG